MHKAGSFFSRWTVLCHGSLGTVCLYKCNEIGKSYPVSQNTTVGGAHISGWVSEGWGHQQEPAALPAGFWPRIPLVLVQQPQPQKELDKVWPAKPQSPSQNPVVALTDRRS